MMSYQFRLFMSQVKRTSSLLAVLDYREWRRSQRADRSALVDRRPWITFRAARCIERRLRKNHRVLEFGGGGSSLFFIDRVLELVTIEHDAAWFAHLEQQAQQSGSSCRWTRRLVLPEAGDLAQPPDPAAPEHYSSADEPSRGKNYRRYAQAADDFANGFFDVVLVDGRSRPACIVHGFPKLKKGGLMVVDNAERSYYFQKTASVFAKMKKITGGMWPVPYSPDFSDTSVWIKIKD